MEKQLRKQIDLLQSDINTLLEYLDYDGVIWGQSDNEVRRMELLHKVEEIKKNYKFKMCKIIVNNDIDISDCDFVININK